MQALIFTNEKTGEIYEDFDEILLHAPESLQDIVPIESKAELGLTIEQTIDDMRHYQNRLFDVIARRGIPFAEHNCDIDLDWDAEGATDEVHIGITWAEVWKLMVAGYKDGGEPYDYNFSLIDGEPYYSGLHLRTKTGTKYYSDRKGIADSLVITLHE